MSTQVILTGGNFTDAKGNPLANGSLVFELSQDVQVNSNEQICGNLPIVIQLDSTGNVLATSPTQSIWPNDVMAPTNTFYTVTGYSATGQLAWGPNVQQVLHTPNPFHLETWIPNQLFYWTPSVNSILLQTNGINNGAQSKLNLVAGSGVSLTDDGAGDITITASGTSQIGFITVPFSTTPSFSMGSNSIATFKLTLTGNVVGSSLFGASAGDIIIIQIIQDVFGSHSFTWPTNFKNTGTISATANSNSTQTFVYDGTNAIPIGPITWN
jgi:hypothetical protein